MCIFTWWSSWLHVCQLLPLLQNETKISVRNKFDFITSQKLIFPSNDSSTSTTTVPSSQETVSSKHCSPKVLSAAAHKKQFRYLLVCCPFVRSVSGKSWYQPIWSPQLNLEEHYVCHHWRWDLHRRRLHHLLEHLESSEWPGKPICPRIILFFSSQTKHLPMKIVPCPHSSHTYLHVKID